MHVHTNNQIGQRIPDSVSMEIKPTSTGASSRIRCLAWGASLLAAISLAPIAAAQADPAPGNVSVQHAPDAGSTSTLPEAPRTQYYPKPGQPAPVLTAGDKVRLASTGAFSPFAAGGWISSAAYELLTNTPANWGTDRGAFGVRLGDSALRAGTEDFLSDGVFAPLFHQDPRYYRLGRGHNPLVRVVYAATRALISRTDSGRTVPNFALMAGNLSGAALSNLYYPRSNRNLPETFATFGSGLGGSAFGYGIAEFFGGLLFDHNFHRTH